MTFDAKGRLWVTTMPSYPMYLPGKKPNDKVLILEDTDGDGKADRCKVFADGLHVPTGIELGDGGVYVSQMPNLMFLKDTDGDDRADSRELIMHGFDTADSHHAMHAFTWDPGGRLHWQEGTFHYSQVETPYGPRRCNEAGIFRWEPKTQEVRRLRLVWLRQSLGPLHRSLGPELRGRRLGRGQLLRHGVLGPGGLPAEARRHEAVLPDAMAAHLRLRAGLQPPLSRRHPGRLPAEQRHRLSGHPAVSGQGGRLGLRRHAGRAAAEVVRRELPPGRACSSAPTVRSTSSTGSTRWSATCSIRCATRTATTPAAGSGGSPIPSRPLLEPAKIAGATVPELLDLLKSYEDRVRYRARRELRERPEQEVLSALEKWVASLDKSDPEYWRQMLEALWLHQSLDEVDVSLLKQLLTCPEPRARAAATRVLCYWRDRVERHRSSSCASRSTTSTRASGSKPFAP